MHKLGCSLTIILLFACGPNIITLEPQHVSSLQVGLSDGAHRYCANDDSVALRAQANYLDGRVLFSQSHGRKEQGKLAASEFLFSVNQGQVAQDGLLALPSDRTDELEKSLHVQVIAQREPSLVGTGEFTPRYDCGSANFQGDAGRKGKAGTNAHNGRDGADVRVVLSYIETDKNGRLIRVRIDSEKTGESHVYVVDTRGPSGTPFMVDTSGGRGGDGGQGTAGVSGISGSDGQTGNNGGACESGGSGGDGSDGGNGTSGADGGSGGNGGNAGTIRIEYDARFPELPSELHFVAQGGEAGRGGSGGMGGYGGPGGSGGSGGAAGPASVDCSTSSGRTGKNGSQGRGGYGGTLGHNGTAGSAGLITTNAVHFQKQAKSEPVVSE